jgi:hypothetical protein
MSTAVELQLIGGGSNNRIYLVQVRLIRPENAMSPVR